ncbi:MAG: hypothetical protein IPO94_03485 [Saprospiraceae bacterium]|nr:hypothetical protein [Saprospiraceae bacterium]
MNKFSSINLILILLIIISGCGDGDLNQIDENFNLTECENISKLGKILSLEESKNFMPYPDSISKIIFTNSQGEEFVGKVNYYKTYVANAFTGGLDHCPIDSQIQIRYEWMPEIKVINIQIDTLDILMEVSISPTIYHEDFSQKLVADICHMFLITPLEATKPNSQMAIIVNRRNHPNPPKSYTEYHDEYLIHGKKYNEVYIQTPNVSEEFTLYFSNHVGIVGFKGEINGNTIDLKFDRIE